MIKRMMIASFMLMNVVHASESRLANLRNEKLLARREELLKSLSPAELETRRKELKCRFQDSRYKHERYEIEAESFAIALEKKGMTRAGYLVKSAVTRQPAPLPEFPIFPAKPKISHECSIS